MTKNLLARAQAFVDRAYVARADARQRKMGLAYVEAERTELARAMARFAAAEIERANMIERANKEEQQ